MKRYGYNEANKLTEIWKERGKYVVGVQGTSHWYVFKERGEALSKFKELMQSKIC